MAQSMGPKWLLSSALWSLDYPSASNRADGHLCPPRRWLQHRSKKGGPGIGYSGHKHQKGEKELTIVENHGFVVGPLSVKPVHQQDTVILPETLTALVDFTHQIGSDLKGAALTLDAGFDSQVNKEIIKAHDMKGFQRVAKVAVYWPIQWSIAVWLSIPLSANSLWVH